MRSKLYSRKFWLAVGGILAIVAKEILEIDVDPEVVAAFTVAIAAYIIGESWIDQAKKAPSPEALELERLKDRVEHTEANLEFTLEREIERILEEPKKELHAIDLLITPFEASGYATRKEYTKARLDKYRVWFDERVKTISPGDPLYGQLEAILRTLVHAWELAQAMEK